MKKTMCQTSLPAFVGLLFNIASVSALSLDVNNKDSIRNAASKIAYDMVSYYSGNITGGANVGLLPGPYYWWEAGAMWGGLIDYWHYTNDSTYNNITTQALLANIGPAYDFVVPTQAFDTGNDDQAFWALTALTAAETKFTNPPSPYPTWLQMADAAWNDFAYRWNTATCGGGLKWQFYTSNAGYDYKDSISNGCFFLISARLLRYTGNTTYMTWAEKVWDWSTEIGLVNMNDLAVYDGTNDLINCTELDHTRWSYNVAVYLLGSAYMYNYTNGSVQWSQRTSNLVTAATAFFSPYPNATSIMYEASCERTEPTCNTDQQSFKAYLASMMYKTIQVAPYLSGTISSLLRASAQAAAGSCSGTVTLPTGITNSACGLRWYIGGFDNTYGVGEQLAALEVIQGLLVNGSSAPGHGKQVHFNGTLPVTTTSTSMTSSTTTTTSLATSSTATSTHSGSAATVAPLAMQQAVLGLAVVGLSALLANPVT